MTRAATPIPEPDGLGAHAPAAVQTLKQAMRRARADNAERSSVVTDLRAAQLGRLELLQEALKPLMAQIPPDIDLFDVGLMPGANPRLFIDMIGFIELGRDARIYHFFQDVRHGRVTLAETADVETMVDAVTDYVARRLLERDQALAADRPPRAMLQTKAPRRVYGDSKTQTPEMHTADPSNPKTSTNPKTLTLAAAPRSGWLWFGIAFAFLLDLLGSITFFAILAALVWIGWRMHTSV